MKSDFLRPDNVEFSKIGKFTSVGIQIVVSFIGLPNRKNIQNVVENNKKYKGILTSQFLLATSILLDGKWRRYRIRGKKRKVVRWIKAFI